MKGKHKDSRERSSALNLWGDLDGLQTVGESSMGGNMCVCVYLCVCDRGKGGGVLGLGRKAIRPRVIKCLVIQNHPSRALHVLSCVYVCV